MMVDTIFMHLQEFYSEVTAWYTFLLCTISVSYKDVQTKLIESDLVTSLSSNFKPNNTVKNFQN